MSTDNAERPVSPERALNRCVARTLADLRRSVKRNRTIPLPTLVRLFKRRWAETGFTPEHAELGQAGLDTVRAYYRRRQPFA